MCFVEGSSSAWPTSYSVAAGSDSSSDSMSLSDEEDAKTASPTFMSRFKEQAKDLANRSPDVARTRTAVLDRNMSQFGSAASELVTSVVSKAVQFPGQRFGVSNFSPSRSPEHVSSKIGQTGDRHVLLQTWECACLAYETGHLQCTHLAHQVYLAWRSAMTPPTHVASLSISLCSLIAYVGCTVQD